MVGDFKIYATDCMHILVRFNAECLLEVSFLETDDSQSITENALSLSVNDLLLLFFDRVLLTFTATFLVNVLLIVVNEISDITSLLLPLVIVFVFI
jgi:hypothetical protein